MGTVLDFLLTAIIEFVFVWLIREFFEIFLNQNKRKWLSLKYELAIWFLYYVLDWYIGSHIEHAGVRIVYTLGFWTLLTLILYKDKLKNIILVVLSKYFITATTEIVVGLSFLIWIKTDFDKEMFPWALAQIIQIFVIKVIKLVYNRKQKSIGSIMDWAIAIFLPCGTIFIVTALLWHSMLDANKSMLLSSGPLAMLVMIILGVFYAFDKLDESAEKEKIDAVYAKELQKYQQQFDEQELAWAEINKFRHDYKNKMLCLAEYANQNDVDGLLQYINSLYKEENYIEQHWKNKTGNAVIDAMLGRKIKLAHQNDIEIKTDINVPPKLPLDGVDLSVILGNALDNAIEASSNSKEKEIYLQIEFKQGNLILHIRNYYNGKLQKNRRGSYITSKANRREHGVGLISIRKTVEKYSGFLNIEAKDNIFDMQIVLSLGKAHNNYKIENLSIAN